jgi:hypothetical protein
MNQKYQYNIQYTLMKSSHICNKKLALPKKLKCCGYFERAKESETIPTGTLG